MDAKDAVRRLLPYHVFQHPAADLAALRRRGAVDVAATATTSTGTGKGKRKATEEDLLREEVAGALS